MYVMFFRCFRCFIVALISLCANFSLYAVSNSDIKADYKKYTCVIDDVERVYKLYLPSNIKPKAPLVFVLHGYGGSYNLDDKGFNEVANRFGFAVCYPQGSKDSRGKNCWNVGYPFQEDMSVDDVSFLCKLAKKLQKEHNLSSRNVFCNGMSNGGEMCYLLAYSRQNTFKAVAPIAGLTMKWMTQAFKRTRPLPLFEIHGTEDRTSEWWGDLENRGGWGAYIAVPDAVNYWVKRNGCKRELKDTLPMKRDDSNIVVTHKYIDAKAGKDVWLYEIIGGGHTWGNKDMNTAEEIWKFFTLFIK